MMPHISQHHVLIYCVAVHYVSLLICVCAYAFMRLYIPLFVCQWSYGMQAFCCPPNTHTQMRAAWNVRFDLSPATKLYLSGGCYVQQGTVLDATCVSIRFIVSVYSSVIWIEGYSHNPHLWERIHTSLHYIMNEIAVLDVCVRICVCVCVCESACVYERQTDRDRDRQT